MTLTIESSGERILASAPAKVNLRLKILAQEETGYHQLETIFCTIGVADIIELVRAGTGIELELMGAELGRPEENLVYRAARAFFSAAKIEPGVKIRLEKQIPVGAGLGGGSSDAATTLIALNELFDRPLTPTRLFRIGAALGSDIPFFLSGAPCALGWGRGERLLPLPALPEAPILLVVPDFQIATQEAYGKLSRSREGRAGAPVPAIIDPEAISGWDGIARIAENDFEPTTFAEFPRLRAIKVSLQDAGASVALLAGSGSTIFGVFPDEVARNTALPFLRMTAPGYRIIESSTTPLG
jgi:4-diphosphocytidyl-2-C-methyl-D-erythritol kinase